MADAQAYRQLLQNLMPPGAAFNREASSTLGALLLATADEFARVDAMVDQLLIEADPRTSFELLPDWERVTGLPDECAGAGDATLAQRRQAVAQRLGLLGGQSIPYLIYIASLIGFQITITEYQPFRVGFSSAGDALTNEGWHHVFMVNAPAQTVRYFTAGSLAGEALATWGNALLECTINRVKPAHTLAIFSYGADEE